MNKTLILPEAENDFVFAFLYDFKDIVILIVVAIVFILLLLKKKK